MKLPFTIDDLRLTMKRSLSAAAPHQVAGRAASAQRGMALIITLILLSVTLVMAIAFLALSNREQNAVKTTTDTAIARYATETALAQAQAQIVAAMLKSPAAVYNSGLLVSTNYINQAGFLAGVANPTNVNYDHYFQTAAALSANDRNLNISNLWLLPRAPVFITTNRSNGDMEFRYWLDLNQNGIFDGNGLQPQLRSLGNYYHTDGTPDGPSLVNVLTNNMNGDPEWVGILERPDVSHGPNNKFLSRYAFIALPSGNALDINAIHNQAKTLALNSLTDGYSRNQGVGSWELNLAAFLADLNTNEWGQTIGDANNGDKTYYYYQYPPGGYNQGWAFIDALSILAYRYNFNYNTLATANNIFPTAATVFPFDRLDGYSDGSLQTTLNTNADFFGEVSSRFWVGANNVNRFFELPSGLFDASKTSIGFTDRLKQAATNNSTYDRYTLYRLLAQLGTESTADDGKLNVNYSNAIVRYNIDGVVTNIAIIPNAETNLVQWEPRDFFIAAADKMLRMYTATWFQRSPSNYLYSYYAINPRGYVDANGLGVTNIQYYGQTNELPAFGVTNIPVYVNGKFVYSPAVNRVLQQAANILDARTTNAFPSVFRPIFWVTNDNIANLKNVYIKGYEDVSAHSRNNALSVSNPPLDAPTNVESLPYGLLSGLNVRSHNVYGVPWIIGAKKGLPAFNQFAMANAAQITRKLQISRNNLDPSVAVYITNQMYTLSVSNRVGLSFWNPYNTDYPRPVTIYAHDTLYVTLSNSTAGLGVANFNINGAVVNSWPGSQWDGEVPNATPQDAAFIRANWTTNYLNDPTICTFGASGPLSFNAFNWATSGLWQFPQVDLLITNYLQTIILDGNNVIDYVQLRDPISNVNLNQILADPNYPDESDVRLQWSTNVYVAGTIAPNNGVINQLVVSADPTQAPKYGGQWKRSPQMPATLGSTPEAESAFYKGFFVPSFNISGDPNTYVNQEYTIQAPYTPTRTVFSAFLMQANDPLVHYLASDLNAQSGATAVWSDQATWRNGVWNKVGDTTTQPLPAPPATPIGGRYQPWGVNKQLTSANGAVDTNAYNLTYKDPLAWGADNWDFPTNAYPSIGWLGRVHRGTPWQTVYLKAHNILKNSVMGTGTGTNTWVAWTGDLEKFNDQYFDAVNMAPLQDRMLFDIFTARLNDNAAHGTLSVNQNNQAAWSAVFGGLVALSNNAAKPGAGDAVSTTNLFINPAGPNVVNSAMWRIYSGITNAQVGFTNANGVGGYFGHVGDILSAPILTEFSPFLNTNAPSKVYSQLNYGISDEVYEWLPQQVLGLLRCPSEPQYTIYCFGQTLRPASGGLVQSGPFFGLITNYQVVAESASRAVIQVHPQVTIRSDGRAVTNYSTTVESFNALAPQ